MYSVTFLLELSVEMTPETKGGKGKRCKKENIDPSQGGRTLMMRSPCIYRMKTALYPCDFMDTARAPYGNFAIDARGPYDYPKSLQSSCDFFPNNHLKSCVVRTISARCPCWSRAMLPTTCLRACDFFLKKNCHSAELNKIVEATAPVNPYNNRMATGCLCTDILRPP